MGVERSSEHSSGNVNVYPPKSHLRPLFFWSGLLQINFLFVLVVFFIFIIFIIVAEVLISSALEILDRLRENFVGDGDTQLQVIMLNAGETVFRCGENRLTSMWSFATSKKLKKLPGSESSSSSSRSRGWALVKLWVSSLQLIFVAYKARGGEQLVAVSRNASQYLRLNIRIPTEGSLGIGDTPLILLLTINIW